MIDFNEIERIGALNALDEMVRTLYREIGKLAYNAAVLLEETAPKRKVNIEIVEKVDVINSLLLRLETLRKQSHG